MPFAPFLVSCQAGEAGESPASSARAALGEQDFDPLEASIPELQDALDRGRTTSRALVETYLARIAAYDAQGPALNAISAVAADALEQADRLDHERKTSGPRGPLHGIPVVVKDNFETARMQTAAGSILLEGWTSGADATLVGKLSAAGAIVFAKTNMHEWAYGGETRGSLFGQTLNPYALDRVPGGSSGGTGVAVAANFASFGLGSDTCGSIRGPAANNDLTGLRPTRGLISRSGVIPLSHTQDTAGPLARSVTDLAFAMDALAGYDPADPITRDGIGHIPPTYTAFLERDGLRGARIGVLTNLQPADGTDPEVARRMDEAAKAMCAEGAVVVDVTMPHLPEFGDVLDGAPTDLVELEFKFDLNDYLDAHPTAPVHSLTEIVASGKYDASVGPLLAAADAQRHRHTIERQKRLLHRTVVETATLATLFANHLDALVYPTLRQKASKLGAPPRGMNCQLSAHSGLPALTVPAGFTDDGVPVGLELLGPAWSEGSLIRLAYAFEQATHHRRLPATTPPLPKSGGSIRAD
ncbi:amidase [Pendulispora albinea]|uniref:Amidase n=1 Tax=Pendulispora albinea TaxID=2741071 RepID=A0ABZ2MBU2_9BACT